MVLSGCVDTTGKTPLYFKSKTENNKREIKLAGSTGPVA